MSDDYKIEQKYDLEQFINTEVKTYSNGDVILPRIFKYYYKCQCRIIFEIYDKLSKVEDLNIFETLQYGTNMVSHVFWTLYSYSLNIKLSMFLTERAVLLFTEFIIMSKNPMLNKEFRFMPNICDALAFSVKKTIGPLQNRCNTRNKKFLKDLSKYKLISINIKYIIQQLLYSIVINKKTKENLNLDNDSKDIYEYSSPYINSDNDILAFLELCSSAYSQTLCNFSDNDNYCFNLLKKFFNNVNEDLTSKICECKLFLDLILEIDYSVKDIKVSTNIVEKYLSSNRTEDPDLNIFNLKNIRKKSFFKKICKKIKNCI
jgi:hypothetical protein